MVVLLDIPTLMNTSLIGLGLLLALYTMISNKISDLREKDNYHHNREKQRENYLLNKQSLTTQDKKEIRKIWDKEKSIISGENYQYDKGFFISGIIFMIVSVGSIICSLINKVDLIEVITLILEIVFIMGLINFFYIWLKIMTDMRLLFKGEEEVFTEINKIKNRIN